MRLLRRIVRRILHEMRSITGGRPPPASDVLEQLAAERNLSGDQSWVASVAVANLKARAEGLSGRLEATAEGRAAAGRRARDIEDFQRFGGRLPTG